jgi:hypothetical protein
MMMMMMMLEADMCASMHFLSTMVTVVGWGCKGKAPV